MRKLNQFAAIVGLAVVTAAPALADTLVLKSGERISGFYEGGTARVVKFRAADGVLRDYDIFSIQQLQFGVDQAASTTTPAAPANRPSTASSTPAPNSTPSASTSSEPRLLPASERPPSNPPSTTAANSAYTIPTGTKIAIRMVDSVNSEVNEVGSTFVATLDEPILLNGLEVVPKGVDVRGRVSNVNEAGRIAGKAELGLELTQIYVNGIPYSLTTSEYAEVGENRAGQTAKRAGIGAGVGAAIGAIIGGGKGAAIGAGVGAGGATAVQVMTKGEKLNIPAETKLEFTLRSALVIAAR